MRGRISIIFGMSVWRNDIKCKYMFMFPLKNLARKELMRLCGNRLRALSQEVLKTSTLEMSLKITNLILQSHLPGANEFNFSGHPYHRPWPQLSSEDITRPWVVGTCSPIDLTGLGFLWKTQKKPNIHHSFFLALGQRCQYSIFKMLNDFGPQSEKCLIYDEMVKNFAIFCLSSLIFFTYIKENWRFHELKWVMIKQNE